MTWPDEAGAGECPELEHQLVGRRAGVEEFGNGRPDARS